MKLEKAEMKYVGLLFNTFVLAEKKTHITVLLVIPVLFIPKLCLKPFRIFLVRIEYIFGGKKNKHKRYICIFCVCTALFGENMVIEKQNTQRG